MYLPNKLRLRFRESAGYQLHCFTTSTTYHHIHRSRTVSLHCWPAPLDFSSSSLVRLQSNWTNTQVKTNIYQEIQPKWVQHVFSFGTQVCTYTSVSGSYISTDFKNVDPSYPPHWKIKVSLIRISLYNRNGWFLVTYAINFVLKNGRAQTTSFCFHRCHHAPHANSGIKSLDLIEKWGHEARLWDVINR
jgi:hypothetical protein